MRQARFAFIAAVALARPLLPQTLTVGSQMDIYQAGGYNDGSGASPPAVFAFPAGIGHILRFAIVTGAWTCSGGVPEYGPDGTSTGPCFHTGGQKFNNPIGPFAGYATSDFEQGLTGMFLEDGLPVSPPPRLRFYVHDASRGGIQTNFEVLSPEIGQVFFIGDGRTGTGAGNGQVFHVPPTATHLYLGFTDNCGSSLNTVPGCFFDNAGSMTATFRIQPENVDWVEPSLSSAPPGRCCAGMAYDQAAHETILFGGFGNPEFYGDTWTWRSGWTRLAPAVSPSPRQGPGMVWDAAAGNIVLFGGMLSDGTYLNDTWTWDGTTWTQEFPDASPPPRRFDTQSMAYDAATKTSVIFGGFDATQNFGDTWTWDGLAKTWTQQSPAASPSPRRTTIAYHQASGTVVLFGGDTLAGAYYNDTWTWNGTTWTQQFPASMPSARSIPSVAYDGGVGLVILFGGYGGAPGRNLNDTWAWNGTEWREMLPATVPAGRWAAAMDYDPLSQGLVLFAGFGTTTLSDTWLFIQGP